MDFKSLSKNEQGALIAGAVVLVFSFFGNFITVNGLGGIYSAWSGVGALAMLLLLGAAAILGIKALAKDTLPDGVPWNLIALGAAGLGLLLSLLRGFTGGPNLPGVDYGPGWSAYVLWIAAAALTYFAFSEFKASGDKMPDFNKKDTPPAA